MDNKWARLLAYVTGLVNQELLLQNEYLAAENRILKTRLQPGWRLFDGERATLAEIGKRLGRKGLQPVARIALTQFQKHYHSERNHQGKGNVLLFPRAEEIPRGRRSPIECRERLGGLLKYYQL